MSHMTTETEDEMLSRDHSGSPLTDEVNSGVSAGGLTVLKKGPWTAAEDAILMDYVHKHGEGNWNAVQKHSGLLRCGKSCRLRWANHLRPNLKKGAFTPEEERLIIELHAKMGNKWARMATHLPGRTDNEIKNYWNTRIKRRQRAGLPLYPPEVCLQQMQESQLNQNDSGDTGPNEDLLHNSFEIPDIIFDNLKDAQGVLSYIPEIPCISTSTVLMNTLDPSDYYGFIPPLVHRPKRPREAATSIFGYCMGVRNQPPQFGRQPVDNSCGNITSQPLGSSFLYDPNSMTNSILPFGENQGCHSLINGNFSASKLSSRSSKLELPSLQYPETDFICWESSSPPAMSESVDAFIQSPPCSGDLHSDCLSPKNSGLLDALLDEANTLSSKNQQLPQKSSNSSPLVPADTENYSVLEPDTKWEEYGDSISPIGNRAASIFSDCTPLSVCGISLGENPPVKTLPGSNIKCEADEQVWPIEEGKKEKGTKLYHSRPDALLGSCWFGRGFAYGKDQGLKADYTSAPIHDDLGNDHKSVLGETTLDQGWRFGSCVWNNMPFVCQISELP